MDIIASHSSMLPLMPLRTPNVSYRISQIVFLRSSRTPHNTPQLKKLPGTKKQSSKICSSPCETFPQISAVPVHSKMQPASNTEAKVEVDAILILCGGEWLNFTANRMKCMLRTRPSFAWSKPSKSTQTKVQVKSNLPEAWL